MLILELLPILTFVTVVGALNSVLRMSLQGKTVLIVQNKGGGHGSIGYYLARKLVQEQAIVTILQDKCNFKKLPFSEYGQLKSLGVLQVDCDLSDCNSPAALSLGGFKHYDVVVDNWSKGSANASFVAGLANSYSAQQLIFISSAGMYKVGDGATPIDESADVKEVNDARKAESEYLKSGLPYTFLRPQYLFGGSSSKRYLDYFISRASRKLPIPLPLHGEQLVCLTHHEEAAHLIGSAVGSNAALNEIFNVGSERYITYRGICEVIHDALGTDEKDRSYLFYDPDKFSESSGIGFPFRKDTFVTSSMKLRMRLLVNHSSAFPESLRNQIRDDVGLYLRNDDASQKWKHDDIKADLDLVKSKYPNLLHVYNSLM